MLEQKRFGEEQQMRFVDVIEVFKIMDILLESFTVPGETLEDLEMITIY